MAHPGGNPAPLNLINVPTPGTPVRITVNITGAATSGIIPGVISARKVTFKAKSGNVGVVYVGYSGMVKASGAKVLFDLSPGEGFVLEAAVSENPYNVLDFYVDADQANDKLYAFFEAH